jgi:hypothetical protein
MGTTTRPDDNVPHSSFPAAIIMMPYGCILAHMYAWHHFKQLRTPVPSIKNIDSG